MVKIDIQLTSLLSDADLADFKRSLAVCVDSFERNGSDRRVAPE